jgi:hypothetical protein
MGVQADLSDNAAAAFHQRAELAAFFYIEAASKVDLDHPWQAYYVYALALVCGDHRGVCRAGLLTLARACTGSPSGPWVPPRRTRSWGTAPWPSFTITPTPSGGALRTCASVSASHPLPVCALGAADRPVRSHAHAANSLFCRRTSVRAMAVRVLTCRAYHHARWVC